MNRPRRATMVGILVLVAVAFALAHHWYGNRHHFFDLGIYRDAMIWWRDHPLYDYARPDATQGALQFTYPPFAALLLYPLGWLSWGGAIWVYLAVSLALFTLVIWWLVTPLADRHGLPRWFVVALALVLASGLEPLRDALTFGQINFVLWALVLFDLLVLAPRGSRLVGVGIGLATAIKLVPGIFIVYLLVTRRFRAAAVAAGTALAATGLAWLLAPQATGVFFTQKLLHPEGVGQLDYVFNQSLLGLVARLAGEPSRPLWVLLALLAAGYGLWRAAFAARLGDEVAGLTLAGIVGSLVSPVTWGHHLFWFVPALVVLVDASLNDHTESVSKTPRSWSQGLDRRGVGWVLAAVVYATTTVSILAVWADYAGQPGGPLGFVMTNWFVWLQVALLVLLPITDRRQVAVDT